MSKYLSLFFLILCGLVFLLSAYAKLYPIELFEFTFVELNIASWSTAPFLSRLLIGLEFFISLALVGNLMPVRWFYNGIILLLSFFSFYLLALWYMQGNEGNCGCFGSLLPMTPLQAIVKNIVMIGLVLFLIRKPVVWNFKYRPVILVAGFILSFSLPFILNPVTLANSETFDNETTGYELEVSIIYTEKKDNEAVRENLAEDKWIIGFFSMTCPHCKLAAYKFRILKEKFPDLKVFMVLNGDDQEQVEFFKETKSEDIPHTRLKGSDFIKLSGPELPKVFFINNKIVVQKPSYYQIDDTMVSEWLR